MALIVLMLVTWVEEKNHSVIKEINEAYNRIFRYIIRLPIKLVFP